MGDTQRLNDTQQLEILALLEAASTERSAMRAARALAELMRHLHVLGQRIAGELPGQDRDGKPFRAAFPGLCARRPSRPPRNDGGEPWLVAGSRMCIGPGMPPRLHLADLGVLFGQQLTGELANPHCAVGSEVHPPTSVPRLCFQTSFPDKS